MPLKDTKPKQNFRSQLPRQILEARIGGLENAVTYILRQLNLSMPHVAAPEKPKFKKGAKAYGNKPRT